MTTKPSSEAKERKAELDNSKLDAKHPTVFFGTKLVVILTLYFTK